MRKVIIKNKNNNLIIGIGEDKNYILQKLGSTGISASTTEKVKSPNQDGSTRIKTLLDDRILELQFLIKTDSEKKLFELQEYINEVLNPKDDLEIIYKYSNNSKKIRGHLLGEIEYLETGKYGFQQVVLSLECDPYWSDCEDKSVVLAVSIPNFYFPLSFDPTIVFSIEINKTIDIFNEGHVKSPIIIEFRGPAINPIVTNETTGEFIKVNKELNDGEVMTINTASGKKSVTIDGKNAFGFIDLNSTFFQLKKGVNTITYDADSGSESAELKIIYNNKYIGV